MMGNMSTPNAQEALVVTDTVLTIYMVVLFVLLILGFRCLLKPLIKLIHRWSLTKHYASVISLIFCGLLVTGVRLPLECLILVCLRCGVPVHVQCVSLACLQHFTRTLTLFCLPIVALERLQQFRQTAVHLGKVKSYPVLVGISWLLALSCAVAYLTLQPWSSAPDPGWEHQLCTMKATQTREEIGTVGLLMGYLLPTQTALCLVTTAALYGGLIHLLRKKMKKSDVVNNEKTMASNSYTNKKGKKSFDSISVHHNTFISAVAKTEPENTNAPKSLLTNSGASTSSHVNEINNFPHMFSLPGFVATEEEQFKMQEKLTNICKKPQQLVITKMSDSKVPEEDNVVTEEDHNTGQPPHTRGESQFRTIEINLGNEANQASPCCVSWDCARPCIGTIPGGGSPISPSSMTLGQHKEASHPGCSNTDTYSTSSHLSREDKVCQTCTEDKKADKLHRPFSEKNARIFCVLTNADKRSSNQTSSETTSFQKCSTESKSSASLTEKANGKRRLGKMQKEEHAKKGQNKLKRKYLRNFRKTNKLNTILMSQAKNNRRIDYSEKAKHDRTHGKLPALSGNNLQTNYSPTNEQPSHEKSFITRGVPEFPLDDDVFMESTTESLQSKTGDKLSDENIARQGRNDSTSSSVKDCFRKRSYSGGKLILPPLNYQHIRQMRQSAGSSSYLSSSQYSDLEGTSSEYPSGVSMQSEVWTKHKTPLPPISPQKSLSLLSCSEPEDESRPDIAVSEEMPTFVIHPSPDKGANPHLETVSSRPESSNLCNNKSPSPVSDKNLVKSPSKNMVINIATTDHVLPDHEPEAGNRENRQSSAPSVNQYSSAGLSQRAVIKRIVSILVLMLVGFLPVSVLHLVGSYVQFAVVVHMHGAVRCVECASYLLVPRFYVMYNRRLAKITDVNDV